MDIASARYVAPAETTSALLLAELKIAHKMLLQAMSQLDELTRGPLPTRESVIDARWTISRRSLARRNLWRRVHDYVSRCASPENAVDLKRLQDSDMTLLRASSQHISRWGIDAVMNDWTAYCEESRAIRRKMKAAIGAEMRLLYPIMIR